LGELTVPRRLEIYVAGHRNRIAERRSAPSTDLVQSIAGGPS
jgi:hypothetical protein